MKKTLYMLTALLVLFISCASAESTGSGAQITLEVLRDETSLAVSSPDFPGIAVIQSETDADSLSSVMTGLLLSLRPDLQVKLVRSFFAALEAWTGTQPEESGLYAGDAFMKAHIRKRFEMTAGEMRSFVALIGANDPFLQKIFNQLPAENISLVGAVYDHGRFFAADLMNGEDCVLTVSADLSDPDEVYLVFGFDSGAACYFHEVSIAGDRLHTVYSERLYRGEAPVFSPEEQTLCQTLQTEFSGEGEKQTFSGSADSILLDAPIRFDGTVTDCTKVSVPAGKVEISLSQLLEYAAYWMQFNPKLNLTDLIRLISNPV